MDKPMRPYASAALASLAQPAPRPAQTRVDAALAVYVRRQQTVERTYAAWMAAGVLSAFYTERVVAFGAALDDRELAYAEVCDRQREAIR